MKQTVPGRYVVFAILAIAAIVVSIAAVMLFGHPSGRIAPPPSIAVLKFDGDADGSVARQAMDALRTIPNFQVADAAAFHRRELRAIGQKLNVRSVLDGSVDASRITVKLFNAADEFELWTKSYPRDSTFGTSLAHDIAGQLSLK